MPKRARQTWRRERQRCGAPFPLAANQLTHPHGGLLPTSMMLTLNTRLSSRLVCILLARFVPHCVLPAPHPLLPAGVPAPLLRAVSDSAGAEPAAAPPPPAPASSRAAAATGQDAAAVPPAAAGRPRACARHGTTRAAHARMTSLLGPGSPARSSGSATQWYSIKPFHRILSTPSPFAPHVRGLIERLGPPFSPPLCAPAAPLAPL